MLYVSICPHCRKPRHAENSPGSHFASGSSEGIANAGGSGRSLALPSVELPCEKRSPFRSPSPIPRGFSGRCSSASSERRSCWPPEDRSRRPPRAPFSSSSAFSRTEMTSPVRRCRGHDVPRAGGRSPEGSRVRFALFRFPASGRPPALALSCPTGSATPAVAGGGPERN